jgi:anti-sigma28 factor (negative regulator of flagellin synthesis)
MKGWLDKYKDGGEVRDATRVATNPILSIDDLEQLQLKREGAPSYQNFKLDQYYGQDREQMDRDRMAKGQTKMGNALTDIGTGMLTWGTEMRPPSQQELERNRYDANKSFGQNWVSRIPSTANAASWGMVDLMTAGAMSKIGKTGRFATDFVPTNRASDVVSDFVEAPIQKAWSLDTPKGNPITLKSLQVNNPKGLHTQVTKDGFINTETALNTIKNSEGQAKYELARKAFPENLPKKMDYNEFKKVINNQLIPLEKNINPVGNSTYGLGRIGNTFTESINQANTITLSNKSKFGRGSNAHNNPQETLGHIHFLRDINNPDIITATQFQSDAFQGPHNIIGNAKTQLDRIKKVAENITKDPDKISKITEKNEQILKEALGPNPAQKQLLAKNHEERFLQEFIDYASQQDGANKVRIPTSETAAKIQGYSKLDPEIDPDRIAKIKRQIEQGKKRALEASSEDRVKWERGVKSLELELSGGFEPQHQTILKKYKDNPKLLKKLGIDVNEVTDTKGNSWYEFDIPEAAKKGEWEIKALGLSPLAASLKGINQQEEFKSGGTLTSSKAKEILRDNTAHGHPLTPKQKRYFGYVAGSGKAENGGWLEKYQDGGSVSKRDSTINNYFTNVNEIDDWIRNNFTNSNIISKDNKRQLVSTQAQLMSEIPMGSYEVSDFENYPGIKYFNDLVGRNKQHINSETADVLNLSNRNPINIYKKLPCSGIWILIKMT